MRPPATALLVTALLAACATARAPREASLGTTNTLVLPSGTVTATYHYELGSSGGELSLVTELRSATAESAREVEIEVQADGFRVRSGARGTAVPSSAGVARHEATLELEPGRKTANGTVIVRRGEEELARDRFDFLLAAEGLRACRPDDADCPGGSSPRPIGP